ncbi:glucose inhibited division protein A [Truepera radiovictrix DSM 17093]|uniref:tRNA uridine 5-carboxymethylaminomethyl modification enzyme MnmG n=1 Tax=Truepera radiovictrix (strain DSM 17093 / CIP 108686 / LMG 22925 / RQ-24) TaxID=649638 RepID=D7CWD8_TRURR|nr:glucose inhibited division protein A [Truepera radiovictrix DSM 17093]
MVVGGGHAGIEAAHAAARLGARVALTLPNPDKIGLMPCNPAIGGPGKSQLVFEVHALGGVMGRLADATAIHARTLNASKGPAVQSLRVQNERDDYAAAARALVEATPGIEIVRGEIAELLVTATGNAPQLRGVRLTDGRVLRAPSVVLCTGTFLAGVVWYGKQQRPAGRQGEAPARHLSRSLRATGHALLRFKTGTPPRIRADSVDFGVLEVVPADDPPGSFSGSPGPRATSSPTWLTHTTPETHALIQANLAHSAMYGGEIEGRGPRYCPSIEDKVVRFADKERHLLFVEPDGAGTSEVYLQGFSSSMPPALQDEMIRTLPGFERAVIQRYAYAVEYDALDPTQLDTTLMSKRLPGLFSAGQINGTSGYEEAAAQGLVAGVNAARFAAGQRPVSVRRDEGYIGVLLDDLVRWGIDEPYRMLTSRNEYRLLHRQDNADERLLPLGHAWGLRDDAALRALRRSEAAVAAELERLRRTRIDGVPADRVLCRPGMHYAALLERLGPPTPPLSPEEARKVEILTKYAAYIERSRRELQARAAYETLDLTRTDFRRVGSLSAEGLEVLLRERPATLGAAGRLRGVRDSDLTALLVHCRRRSGDTPLAASSA